MALAPRRSSTRRDARPLASLDSALMRLARFQAELGRPQAESEFLSDLVGSFMRVYTVVVLTLDPRFKRFQDSIKQAVLSLGQFTHKELERALDSGGEPQSLANAKEVLDHLFGFYVRDTPWSNTNRWGIPAVGLNTAEFTDMARRTPRVAMARYILRHMAAVTTPSEYWAKEFAKFSANEHRIAQHMPPEDAEKMLRGARSLSNMSEFFAGRLLSDISQRPLTPSELMLLAAIHGLPGETFTASPSDYEHRLDAWSKALRRAAPDNRRR